MEASPTTSNDKRNDGQQQPADEDSDEDLCGVVFPIIDNTETGDQSSASDMGRNGGGGNFNVNGSAIPVNRVDEDAVIRCFDLSVNAHIERSCDVKAFEPMAPKNNDEATSVKDASETVANENDTKEENQPVGQSEQNLSTAVHSKKDEWSPSSLPLPSWAKNIP
eukprot:CAMPEP_0172313840 /NCGR_PEP_ID=MMETSP1058-20130122/21107_1 /TAXON_ID=83371 /ORGANISM="Detonula confervacea, Strain CCMP 353" /LENGTH=164 /DNA_ID=CAMNT_0013027561 /DNA_START=7 /DNA_END=501 /DNA_ORIENTATION=-